MRTPTARPALRVPALALLLLACQSGGEAVGDPLVSPDRITATLDGRPWASATASASYTVSGGVIKLIVDNPADPYATRLKIVIVGVPYGPASYPVNGLVGSEEITTPSGAWGSATATTGCQNDCSITDFPTWGTVTFTRLDAERAVGTFAINPRPHTSSGSFDVIFK